MKRKNQGFSLVELIIVIAIMTVLIGFMAPQYLRFVKHSKISTDIYNVERIARKIDTAIADCDLLNDTANNINDLVGIVPEWEASGGVDVVTWDEEFGVTQITLGGVEIYPDPEPYKNLNGWH